MHKKNRVIALIGLIAITGWIGLPQSLMAEQKIDTSLIYAIAEVSADAQTKTFDLISQFEHTAIKNAAKAEVFNNFFNNLVSSLLTCTIVVLIGFAARAVYTFFTATKSPPKTKVQTKKKHRTPVLSDLASY